MSVLHMFCGKAGSGKTTLARELGAAEETMVLCEDEWLSTLFGDQMATFADYVTCSRKLEQVIGPHVVALLAAGMNVVMDFQANTVARRAWLRRLAEQAGSDHQLHFLDVSDDICLERIKARGDHPFGLSEAQFHQLSRYFVPPEESEGLNIIS